MARTSRIDDQNSPDSGTLGALLYADSSKHRIAEAEWVELVRRVSERDQRALRTLYEGSNRIVFTLMLRLTKDRETAEELTLDVFHDLWRRAESYDPADGTVLGWIMNQARSRAIDRLRFVSRKKRSAPKVSDPDGAPAAMDPQDQLAVRQKTRGLRLALESLTEAEREAIEITYFSDLTYAEAAERLDQPVGTVKTRIRSGLEKLRRALPARGIRS